MTDQLDARAAELFNAAIDHDAAARPAFLDEACGGSASLRGKVEALLEADEAAGGFLDSTVRAAGAPLSIAPASEMIGRRVGRYRIERPIGCGGMGAVYEATQEHPRRSVALKIMRSGIVSASTLRRFEYEVEILARLRHPGVVQVYEAGTHNPDADPGGGVPYFAMEYIPDARSILVYSRQVGLRTRQKLELFTHVCDAVHHGHQNGVIHRDIKPGNILVDAAGQPKVIDFGVARAIGSDLAVTSVQSGIGQLIGTLRYMSPEQCDADAPAIDVRSDVYALGVVLYELLTARLPYDLSSPSIARALQIIRDVAPALLSGIDRALRGDIETIVLKCLSKERERRYQGVGELAEDIRRYLDQRPIAARPPSVAYQLRTFAKRNKILVGGVAAVFVALLAGVVGTSWGLVEATKQTRAAQFQAYVANVIGADAALQINDSATARQRLDAAPDEYRNWEWRYLNNQVDASVRTIRLELGDFDSVEQNLAGSLAVSPDGQFLALSRGRVLRSSTGETTATLADTVCAVVWSRDGHCIATADGADRTARVWDAATGEKRVTFPDHSDEVNRHSAAVNAVAFSPDGLRIATGSRDSHIKIWDVASGACLATFPKHPGEGHQGDVLAVAFSPDGTRLVSGSSDHSVKIWNLAVDSEIPVRELVGHTSGVTTASFDSSGERVVSAALDGTVRIWDARQKAEPLVLRGPTKRALCAAFSPDDRIVATGWGDSTIRLWNSATGESLATLRGHGRGVAALKFTPDGRQLVSGGGDATIKVWDPATVPELTLCGHVNETVGVAFSPDGKLLASAGFDTTVRLWDTATSEELAVLEGHEGLVRAIAFAPDGSMIASGGVDHTVRIWDPIKARQIRVLVTTSADFWGVMALTFSPDGRWLAAQVDGAAGAARLWDLQRESQAPAWECHDSSGEAIAFSPDGAYFLDSGPENGVRIWRTRTRELVRVLSGQTAGSVSAAFSPDGRRVASVCYNRTLYIWDAQSGATLHCVTDLNADPQSLAFNPDADGSRLAICFHDGTVKLWDTRNWQVVERLQCEDAGWLYSITFDPQGRRLACGSTAGTIWLWDTDRLTTRTVATTAARVLRLEAEPLVARLFGDGGSAVEVIDRLADEPDISAEVRSAALRLVRTRAGSPAELFRTAWEIVCDPNAATGPYERARAIGVSLLRFHPNDTRYLTAVGLSQFRLGDYHSSRAALLLARKVDASTNPQTDAASRAFLAMTYFKLGELAEAEAELAQLREWACEQPQTADEQVQSFLREAESTLNN